MQALGPSKISGTSKQRPVIQPSTLVFKTRWLWLCSVQQTFAKPNVLASPCVGCQGHNDISVLNYGENGMQNE